MKEPKYERLKMGNPEPANKYGQKLKRYLKWKSMMEVKPFKK
tara:strand:- start:200 stop:325 length:126 start_codon:yes stop_codon:yes gene_type:complete